MSLSDDLTLTRDREALVKDRKRLLDELLAIDCQIQEIDDLIGPEKTPMQTLDASVVDAMRGEQR